MITTHIENFSDVLKDMEPLFVHHHKEIGNFIEKMHLDPDYDTYRMHEQKGSLRIITVRENGELIAYYCGFLKGGLHYRSTMTNTEDIFWLKPERRNAKIGTMLFDAVKSESIRCGVKWWRTGAKINTPADKFLESYGFKKIENHYGMWLGE